MEKLTRLGMVLLATGISLLLVTALRGSSPNDSQISLSTSPFSWNMVGPQLWVPRNLRITVISEAEIDIYVLDQNGIGLWNKEKVTRALFTFRQVKRDICDLQLTARGKYALLIQNPSNTTGRVELALTFYGFECDLTLSSFILMALGGTLALAKKASSISLGLPRFSLPFSRLSLEPSSSYLLLCLVRLFLFLAVHRRPWNRPGRTTQQQE